MRARETELTNEWMSACSFERCYRVVSAINAISIHEKLKGSGYDGESRLDEVRKAKDVLLDFIEIFSDIVNDAERHPERIVVGVDPRTGDLAQRFLSIKRQQPRTSSLATVSLEELSDLVEPEDDADRRRLLDYLRDLRNLLEDHALRLLTETAD